MLCFPNAGSAEDMYTSEGTGARRSPSPLLVSNYRAAPASKAGRHALRTRLALPIKRRLQDVGRIAGDAWQEWCRASGAECLAVQPPGRNMRSKEAPLTSCQAISQALLPVVASKLADAPYIVRLPTMPAPLACPHSAADLEAGRPKSPFCC